MADLLSTSAIDEALAEIPGWKRDGNAISRTWERKGFNGAIQLTNVIAYVVNKLNHHPEILIHEYKKVTVTSTTHDANGVTGHDIELARQINKTLGES